MHRLGGLRHGNDIVDAGQGQRHIADRVAERGNGDTGTELAHGKNLKHRADI
jgi:hypothetical protein